MPCFPPGTPLFLRVTMPDGSTWDVPVEVIARDRAKYYADLYDGDIESFLKGNTWPLFARDDNAVEVWAETNMNWSDVVSYAVQVEPPKPVDYQEGWVKGNKTVIREVKE